MADRRDSERELFGNGTLTVAARLASAIGVPSLGVIMVWLGVQVWNDVKALRDDKVALASTLTALTTRIAHHDRWNEQQDTRLEAHGARIERLVEMSRPQRDQR